MTGSQIFAIIQNAEQGVSISNIVLATGEQDTLAGKIMLHLNEWFPDATNGEILDALDTARWWLIFLASQRPLIQCAHCKHVNPPYSKTKAGELLCRVCIKQIFGEE